MSYFRCDPGTILDAARQGLVSALLGQLARVEGEIDERQTRRNRAEPCGYSFRESIYDNAVARADSSPEWDAASSDAERSEIAARFVAAAFAEEERQDAILLAQRELVREQLRLFGWGGDCDPYEHWNEDAQRIRLAEAS
jgi:hypothetical protein